MNVFSKRIFASIFLMLTSCTVSTQPATTHVETVTPPEPSITPQPTLFPSSAPAVRPALKPTLTLIPIANPISEFPLTVGSYWVYSGSWYEEEQKTVWCCVTVTVVKNEMQPSFFLAKLKVERTLASGILPPNVKEQTWSYWLVINDKAEVFILTDPPRLSKLDNASLAYVFPLGKGQPCWYSDPVARANNSGDHCTWSEGPIEKDTPAGIFQDCYWIVTPFLSGGAQEWFCYGVGPIGNKYDHIGSKFGDESYLIEYHIQR